jgi:hypothetical protein
MELSYQNIQEQIIILQHFYFNNYKIRNAVLPDVTLITS